MNQSITPPPELPLALAAPMAEYMNHLYTDYQDLVKEVGSHPDNSRGADKSWVERAMWDYQQHYRKATRGS